MATIHVEHVPITTIEALVVAALTANAAATTVGNLIVHTNLDPFSVAEALNGLLDKHVIVQNSLGEYALAQGPEQSAAW